MDAQGLEEPPCTVSASYDVQLRRPTPHGATLTVNAKPTEVLEDRVRVSLTLEAEGKVCVPGAASLLPSRKGILPTIAGPEAVSCLERRQRNRNNFRA